MREIPIRLLPQVGAADDAGAGGKGSFAGDGQAGTSGK